MAGFGNTPVTTGTPVGTPLGSVAVPGHSGGDLTALEGGPASTDSNGNETAPVSAWVKNANANGQATMSASSPVAIASDQSAVKTKTDFLEIAGQGAGNVTGTSTPIILAQDVSLYKAWSFQMTGSWSMTLQVQFSNDNASWFPIFFRNVFGVGAISGITGNGLYTGPICGRYMRIIPSAWTSNASGVGVLELYTVMTGDFPGIQATQSGTWTISTQVADLTLLASAAQTTTQTLADQSNPAARGVRVVLDMTTVGTGSVTLEIDAKDVASGKYMVLLTGAAVTTNSTNVYIVHPDLTAAANSIAKDILPRTWRVKVTANNANSATYSVGASYLI
jgi:hypothetical protein